MEAAIENNETDIDVGRQMRLGQWQTSQANLNAKASHLPESHGSNMFIEDRSQANVSNYGTNPCN